MTKQTVIKFTNVSKKYALGQRGYRTLRQDIYKLFDFRKRKRDNRFSALKNISFQVKKGEVLGIIGPNGAGKSTVLKLLAGITLPTEGKIYKEGRIAAMIELAAGFHPELTGRENIYLYGSIMGMKKKEIEEKFQQIVDFSEIGGFMDTPLKRYSSGMQARLGFSVSSHIDADILLIDEVLSVGDMSFKRKCVKKMQEYLNSSRAVIFVSHNLNSIRRLCQRTILLDRGKILIDGPTEEAIERYSEVFSESKKNKAFIKGDDGQKRKIVEIKDIKLLDNTGKAASCFTSGDMAIFRFMAKFNGSIENADFGFFIRREDRLIVFDTSLYKLEKFCMFGKANTTIAIEFKFRVNLLKGDYYIGMHIADLKEGRKHIYYDYIDKAAALFVDDDISWSGVANLHPEIKVIEEKTFDKIIK